MIRISDWEELLERELGEESVRVFHEIMNGKREIPVNEEWFDGIFTYSRGIYQDCKVGKIENAVIWKKKEAEK